MRFLRVRVGRFGPLRDAVLGEPEPLGGLVAVLGPNEAGKSTVHQILVSILFGFRPAARDTNPYTPWDGSDIDISGELELDDGQRVIVQRRLAGSPSGHLIHENHEAEAIANRDLPDVGHLDRRVFSEVYGITQLQLASLGKSTWAAVQDDLVTGLGAQDLRAPRTVAKQLEDAANRLWRPDARGKPRSRSIQAKLAEETEARRHAAERDGELRSVRREMLSLTSDLETFRERAEDARDRRKTLRELVPLARRIEEMDCLESGLRDTEALAGLPRDPARVWREMRGRVDRAQQRLDGLDRSRERAIATADSLADVDRSLLERADLLGELAGRTVVLDEWSGRETVARAELARLEDRIAERSPRILGGPSPLPADPDLTGRIRSVDVALLSNEMERLDEARRRPAATDHAAGPKSEGFWVRLALACAAVLVVGLLIGLPILWASAAVALAGVVLVALVRRRSRREAGPETGDLVGGSTREDIRTAEARVRSALEPIGAPSAEPVRAGVAERVEAIQSLLRDRDARAEEIQKIEGERVSLRERLVGATRGLDIPLPEDLGEALRLVRSRVDEAKGRERTASEGRRDADRLSKEIEEADAELSVAKDALEAFEAAVTDAGGTPTEAGLKDLAERRSKLDHLERLRREVAAHDGGIDGARARLAELGRKIEGDDRDMDAAEAAVDQLEVEIREAESRRSALEERERGLLERETVDVIDGRIERLTAEMDSARREHDRLLVLARVLSRAEERFRSERQPGLLRTARVYLDRITAGRYGRILVGDRGAGGGFLLDAEHLPEPHEIEEPLSLGTREQVYLALRLAIADHLDQGRESLPLLLDEVLASWDPDRRRRALTLLAEEARRRQVFVFTCHPHIAEEVADLGGTVIDLSSLSKARAEDPNAGSGQPELELGLE